MKKVGVEAISGVKTSGIYSGIKSNTSKLDLGLIVFDEESLFAAVTTRSTTCAPSVLWTRKQALHGKIKAILVNSGNANTATATAAADHQQVIKQLAQILETEERYLIYNSTGIIGKPLPVDKVVNHLPKLLLGLGLDSGEKFANSILTTDTGIKAVHQTFKTSHDYEFQMGAVAKGSGMIHPNLATMLTYLVTDATLSLKALRQALKTAAQKSFNQMSVDLDMSTSDTVLLVATGTDKANEIRWGTKRYADFVKALTEVCIEMAKQIARDGEGATKLIEVQVKEARHEKQANKIAKQIICSPLVKTAIHGGENNWGRVYAAIGATGLKLKPEKIKIAIENIATSTVTIKVHLGLGKAMGLAWGCDLSKEYIDINTNYN